MTTEKLIKYSCFIFLVGYQFLGMESMLARGLLAAISLMIVICMGKSCPYMHRSVILGISLLLFLNILYYLCSPKTLDNIPDWNSTGFFANTMINLGIFFVAYYLTIRQCITTKNLQIFFVLIFIAASIRFFVTKDLILFERNGHMNTMNMAYNFVIFLPYLLLFRNKLIPLIFLLPTLYYVMYGGKRGAIIIAALAILFILYNYYLQNANKHIVQNLILLFIILYIGITISEDVFQNNELLQHRLDQTFDKDSSGRDNIWQDILTTWENGNIFQLICGFGFCSSVRFAGNYAHNDWLELLSTAGLLGVIIYFCLFCQMIHLTRQPKMEKGDKQILLLICGIWFLKSLFSMSYCNVENMPMTFLCGYIVGKQQITIKKPQKRLQYVG